MYVVDVIPLVFLPRNQDQILSYFSENILEYGTAVEVAIGSRKVNAIVISCDTIKSRKLTLKKGSDFKLKNVNKILSEIPKVTDWQIKIAMTLSSYYYAPLGIALKTVLPSFWFTKSKVALISNALYSNGRQNIAHETKSEFIQITNLAEHYVDYLEEIRDVLDQKKQVFLMVPEQTHGQYFMGKFAELEPAFISSDLSMAKQRALWQAVANGEKKLIIGTRVGLFLPFQKLELLIVDDESNEAYKSDMTPRYHASDLAHDIAQIHGAKLISSAIIPRLETYHLDSSQLQTPNSKLSTRVVDMRREVKDANYSYFSRDLKEGMTEAINDNQKVILYVPRRGYSNLLSCQHCGASIKCLNCDVSMVYHKTVSSIKYPSYAETSAGRQVLSTREKETVKDGELICHRCQTRAGIPKACPTCQSYKLKLYGVGTAGVEERVIEWAKYLPESDKIRKRIFVLDMDTSKKFADEEKIIAEFQKPGSAVLITTQMIFSHIYLIHSDLLGIINANALIHIPDFRSEENLFRQLYTLSKMTYKLIIQTHNPQDPAIQKVVTGDMISFLKEELGNRAGFDYPPFTKLIKLSYAHRDNLRAKREARVLYEKLSSAIKNLSRPGRGSSIESGKLEIEALSPAPAFIAKERGQYLWNVILKIKNPVKSPAGDHGTRTRNELLRYVPTGWTVDVDPRNLI